MPPPQHDGWSWEEPVCDTVRCGETAVFSIRDGLSCANSVAYTMQDSTRTHTFSCAPGNATNSPCQACPGNTVFDGCRWTWKAPDSVSTSLATKPPSSDKCRCTQYKPFPASDWLCSLASSTTCPGPTARRHRRHLLGTCPAPYTGSNGCWLKDNWSKIMQLQGLGPDVDALVMGAGDRTVSLNLEALKCACSAWNLAGKALAVKTAPCVSTFLAF
jgi:hypothetical protein